MMKISRKFKKKQIFMLVVLLCLIFIGLSFLLKQGVEVNGVTVVTGDVDHFIEETGVVRAVTAQKVYSKFGGEVVKIHVMPGDQVKRGDALADLSTSDSELHLLSLEAKKKSLEKALEALKKPIDSESLKIALGDVNASKTALNAMKKDYDNGVTLFEAGGLSQDALSQLKLHYEQAKVASNQAQERYNLLKKGNGQEVIDQAQAELDAITYDLQLLSANQEGLSLLSPLEGTVVEKMIEKGEYLQPSAYTYEIADLRQLYIEVELLVSDVLGIEVGSVVDVTLEDANLTAKGVVERIYPKAFSKLSDLGVEQKRIRMDIALKEQVQYLYGSEVTVKLYRDQKKNVLLVPDSALFKQGDVDYVFLVQGDRIALQPVELGLKGNKAAEIIKGLTEGQVIVDTPDSKRVPNEKVKVNIEEK
jgi:HlyD family secretion protein